MEGDCVTRSDKNRVSVAERFPTRDVWRIEIENMLANDKPIKSDPNTKIRKSNHFQWNQKTTKSKVSENASKENRGRKKRCKMSNSKQEGGRGWATRGKKRKIARRSATRLLSTVRVSSAGLFFAAFAFDLTRSIFFSFLFGPETFFFLGWTQHLVVHTSDNQPLQNDTHTHTHRSRWASCLCSWPGPYTTLRYSLVYGRAF